MGPYVRCCSGRVALEPCLAKPVPPAIADVEKRGTMTFRRRFVVGLFAAAGTVAVAQADSNTPDPVNGALLANTCLGCHGVEGIRNAYPSYRVPKLGGQNAEYIVLSLQAYQQGLRQHPTMNANARHLTEDRIRDIAAFFSQTQ